ncbi:MAG: hypothetical protein AAGJ18_31310, partial [Bacteroidota bacterium]
MKFFGENISDLLCFQKRSFHTAFYDAGVDGQPQIPQESTDAPSSTSTMSFRKNPITPYWVASDGISRFLQNDRVGEYGFLRKWVSPICNNITPHLMYWSIFSYLKKLVIWIPCFLFYFNAFTQNHPQVVALKIITNTQTIPENTFAQYTLTDSIAVPKKLITLIDSLRQAAFLTASIDSLTQKDSAYIAHLFLGKKYNNFCVTNGNIEKGILKSTRIGPFLNQSINYLQLKNVQEKLLVYAENNGYPFASILLTEVQINDEKVVGKLVWDKGKLIRLGGLKTEGEAPLNVNYLKNYLGLKKGNIYRKNKIIATSQKLQELPFIKETRSPAVQFRGNEAIVNLFLAPKKANRFDFLLGVLPNNQETGKVLITADIDAEFQNQFGKGERIAFAFEQLRPETQQLTLETNYPYLLTLPLGVDFEFGLYKRDSTYRDLSWSIGL